jgi:hypothetical protein
MAWRREVDRQFKRQEHSNGKRKGKAGMCGKLSLLATRQGSAEKA